MLVLLTIFNKSLGPYLNTIRRRLAEENINPLTITYIPNFIGHPLGIIILVFSGMFLFPRDPLFFIFWFGLILITSISSIYSIIGLVNTKFYTAQVIGNLGFVSSSICAAVFLGDHLNSSKIICLFLATFGVLLLTWPKELKNIFVFDKGIIFTLLAVILGGFASVFYKAATYHVTGFGQLMTGRFIADIIGCSFVWFIGMRITNRSAGKECKNIVLKAHGRLYILGIIIASVIDSWIIYKFPVSTIAIIGTISFPVTYLFSSIKYKENITSRMLLGTLIIIGSIILFIFNI